MKKKILIGSIFAVLLMLSMPMVSNMNAEPIDKPKECSMCSSQDTGICFVLDLILDMLEYRFHFTDEWHPGLDTFYLSIVFIYATFCGPF